MAYSVKMKELYAYIYRKYLRTCPSTKTKSTKFFLFAVVFLQPLCSFSLFFFFSLFFSAPFFFVFLRIIYYGFFYHFLHPRAGQVLGVLFLCFTCLFLNLPFLAVRLLVHCSGIISTLMQPESQLGSI